MQQLSAPTISFETKLFTIGSWVILRLPESASAQLPSRGQTMVKGTINGAAFQNPLEPDGKWSHWFKVDKSLLRRAHAAAGDTVAVTVEVMKDWPEPEVPADLAQALAGHPQAYGLWQRITPLARWEWIRWSRSTNNPETRKKRVAVAMSKLEKGMRRPCCWNRNLCTEPYVSKNGVLLEPTQAASV